MGFDPLSSCEDWLETTMSTRMEEGKKVKSMDCTANMRERPISGNSSSYQCVMLRGEYQHIDEILVGPCDPPPSELVISGEFGSGRRGRHEHEQDGYISVMLFVILR